MENWIIETMENFGYFGILLLIMLENIFPPIPSEVILTFGGAMTVKTSMTITGVVTVSTIGSVLGAIILYFIGSLLDIRRLEKIIEKWGHILRLKKLIYIKLIAGLINLAIGQSSSAALFHLFEV